MSEVASLALCETLYSVSGWRYTQRRYVKSRKGNVVDIDCTNVDTSKVTEIAPAYDLGYLSRNLADISESNLKLWYAKTEKVWKCEYVGTGVLKIAEFPEDAICKLAIELFKQKILEKIK